MIEALAANRCMIPLLVPVLDRGEVSMTTIQYTALGSVLSAFARVINAMTPTALSAHGMAMKQSPAKTNDPAANQQQTATRQPDLARIQSDILPPITTVKHDPSHGIIPTYQSEARL